MLSLSTIMSTKGAGERRSTFTSAMVAGWNHVAVSPVSYLQNQPKLTEDTTGVASEGVSAL